MNADPASFKLTCSVCGCAQTLEREVNMDKRWSTVYAVIVIFSTMRTVDTGRQADEPSRVRCPRHLNPALSHKGCRDCHIDHICCVYGGENFCIPPLSDKPGMCPLRPLGSEHCIISCSYDVDCPNNEKCCSNGCGHECMAPATEPEYCPWHPNLSLSHKGCKDCPADHKCCVYDGEHYCVPPVTTKPGFCSRRHFGVGLCIESCSHDSDCPGNNKCCFNGCGHECKAPAID